MFLGSLCKQDILKKVISVRILLVSVINRNFMEFKLHNVIERYEGVACFTLALLEMHCGWANDIKKDMKIHVHVRTYPMTRPYGSTFFLMCENNMVP